MSFLRSIVRQINQLLLCLAAWLLLYVPALAQVNTGKKEESGNSYVLSYFLVLLGIAMGMALVCRAANRRDRALQDKMDKPVSAKKK